MPLILRVNTSSGDATATMGGGRLALALGVGDGDDDTLMACLCRPSDACPLPPRSKAAACICWSGLLALVVVGVDNVEAVGGQAGRDEPGPCDHLVHVIFEARFGVGHT